MISLNELLKTAVEKKGSDLHLKSDSSPVLRINRRLNLLKDIPPLSHEDIKKLAYEMLPKAKKEIFEKDFQVDSSYEFKDQARFRLNVFQQRGKIGIVMRNVSSEIRNFEDLGLPKVLEKISEERRGLVLVTGTCGSGKSTTLAAMINRINETRDAHIITIEDPIEFLFKDKKSIITQRELGVDTPDYPSALRHVVRQDPDVILVGEMRDLDTMRTALTSAQLGNLVFSTIHTINAYQTITRIMDMFPPHEHNQIRFMLADTLQAVVSQRLLPKKDGSGMIPAIEVLIITPLIRKYIEENKLSEISPQMEKGEYYGMQTFNQSLFKLYQEEKIELDTAKQASSSAEELMLLIKGVGPSTIST